MRDAQNISDVLLIKNDKAYKIIGIYLTQGLETYAKVKAIGESTTTNYPYPSFSEFIDKHNFKLA